MRPSCLTLGKPALRAFLVAPLGAIITLGLIAVLYLVLAGERSLLEWASTWGFVVAVLAVGTPLAYLVTGAIVWPGYAVLRRAGWFNPGTVLLGGAAVGALTVPLCWHGFIGRTQVEWLLYLSGASAGCVAGGIFWVLHPPQPKR
jgi:hypothetical protein